MFLAFVLVAVGMMLFVPACQRVGRELSEEEKARDKRFLYVEDRYKTLEKGMTLKEASDILDKDPSDSTSKHHYLWLYRDTVVEVELDDQRRIKDITFTPGSKWQPPSIPR
jgi:hypothetical protein